MRTLVLGLGNPILRDDGVGIYAVRATQAAYDGSGVDFAEASVGGLRLLSLVEGYDRVILVDAIITPGGRPGQIYRLPPDGLCASLHADCSHDMSLPAALEFGRKMGMVIPEMTILAVEVEEVTTFGERCTPAVEAAIPRVVEAILAELGQAAGEP